MCDLLRSVGLALIIAAPAVAAAQCPDGLGDIDANGTINVVDVQCGVLVALGQLGPEGAPVPGCVASSISAADVNCNETVDVADIQSIIALSLGLALPVPLDADGDGCPDACEVSGPPEGLRINELFYSDGGEETNSFVELWGPAGESLTGVHIVGVNGNGGGDYNAIALSGTLGSDGYFVVAFEEATGEVLAAADLLSENADYQNGPDSVQLRFGDSVLDAVAYGTFSGGLIAKGEGIPAALAEAGHSIGRDFEHTDSDQNAEDFEGRTPTPGFDNEPPNQPPVVALDCPAPIQFTQELSLHVDGSTDPEGGPLVFEFDWGDGELTGPSPSGVASHLYDAPGVYLLAVTATDDDGLSTLVECTVVVDGSCGNGVLDPGEECDDGDNEPGPCTPTCEFEILDEAGLSLTTALDVTGYTTVCRSVSWGSVFGEGADWYEFTIDEPSRVAITIRKSLELPVTTCPTSVEPPPCGSGPADDSFTLRNGLGQVILINGKGGPNGCPGLDPDDSPSEANLPAGTFYIEYQVETNGLGVSCSGSAAYCMQLDIAPVAEHCGNGICAPTESCASCVADCGPCCTDACGAVGEASCAGSLQGVCGDFDQDGCKEIAPIDVCEAPAFCAGGSCLEPEPLVDLKISEVVYNSVGPDTDVFVELAGPAGASLNGFRLVGVNGNGGVEYNPIALAGTFAADGLFVVAHPDSTSAIASQADQFNDNVDYQNGPDSILLLFGDTVVDAVGYGDFSAAEFAGEGAPAPSAAAGQSLGRDELVSDTNDNATDFTVRDIPSPGELNPVVARTRL